MNRRLEHRLGEFVDRSNELKRFKAVLDAPLAERIVVVWGEEACGKSSLMMRFVAELTERRLSFAEVDWKGSRNYDYLAFLRSVRDQLRAVHGDAHFAGFTDLVNFFTKPNYNLTLDVRLSGNINILNDAVISSGATIGDVTGVVIQDAKIVVPRSDLAIADGERVVQLTRAFAQDLARVAADKHVLLLDSAEKIDAATLDWLWTEFLPLLRDEELGDVIVVLCGQQPPPTDGGWVRYILELALPPLGIDDIKDYLRLRNAATDAEMNGLAMFVAANTRGKAGSVAEAVDLYVRFKENQAANA